MTSRLLQIIGLFGRIQSLLYGSFAKETYNCKEPTSHSHPIGFAGLVKEGGRHTRLHRLEREEGRYRG